MRRTNLTFFSLIFIAIIFKFSFPRCNRILKKIFVRPVHHYIYYACFITIFLLNGCEDSKECTFPLTHVDVTIDRIAELSDLGSMNSKVYPKGHEMGYARGTLGGLIIFKKREHEFYAFDLACPHEIPDTCILERESEADLVLECPCCGSEFILNYEGAINKGPAKCPLHQYRTWLDGNRLYITD